MPCYSRVSSSVEFGDGTDAGLLAKALQSLGYIVGRAGPALRFSGLGRSGLYQNGQLTVNGSSELTTDQVNEIKRAYSAEVVKSAAQRFGWQAKQQSPTQFQVTRRF
jgi:hypothetical protein